MYIFEVPINHPTVDLACDCLCTNWGSLNHLMDGSGGGQTDVHIRITPQRTSACDEEAKCWMRGTVAASAISISWWQWGWGSNVDVFANVMYERSSPINHTHPPSQERSFVMLMHIYFPVGEWPATVSHPNCNEKNDEAKQDGDNKDVLAHAGRCLRHHRDC